MSERVLVCGSRDWADAAGLHLALDMAHREIRFGVVIHGDCRGADRIAQGWAQARGIPDEAYPVAWHLLGKAAGPLRNQRMVDEGRPTYAIAVHDAFARGTGTWDAMSRTINVTVRAWLLYHDGNSLTIRDLTAEEFA